MLTSTSKISDQHQLHKNYHQRCTIIGDSEISVANSKLRGIDIRDPPDNKVPSGKLRGIDVQGLQNSETPRPKDLLPTPYFIGRSQGIINKLRALKFRRRVIIGKFRNIVDFKLKYMITDPLLATHVERQIPPE